MRLLLILLFLSFNIFASSLDDFAKEMKFERDYNTALTKAKEENKFLVMILSSSYCPWCRKFEKKTLSTSHVQAKLTKEVITLIVDKKYDIASFPKKFRVQFVPTVFFIDPHDESIFKHHAGYVKEESFILILDEAREIYEMH